MIEILSTGGLTTVQDMGRRGWRRFGVGVGGPLDALAATIGNRMLGNPADAAFLEVAIFPLRLRFTQAGRVAVTGSDAQMELDGQRFPPWWSVPVQAGQELTLRAPASGGVAYLCVAGGLDVPLVLGSRSTDLKAGFGGLQGRALRRGDTLAWLPPPRAPGLRRFGVLPPRAGLPGPEGEAGRAAGETLVRVLPAAQWQSLDEAGQAAFLSTRWQVSPDSNRIGLRLRGPRLHPTGQGELLSHGILPGVVQLPPQGEPIVMQCDAQTAGGYPKLATVIAADLWRLAQTPIGGGLRFQCVDMAQALAAQQAMQAYVARVARAVELHS